MTLLVGVGRVQQVVPLPALVASEQGLIEVGGPLGGVGSLRELLRCVGMLLRGLAPV